MVLLMYGFHGVDPYPSLVTLPKKLSHHRRRCSLWRACYIFDICHFCQSWSVLSLVKWTSSRTNWLARVWSSSLTSSSLSLPQSGIRVRCPACLLQRDEGINVGACHFSISLCFHQSMATFLFGFSLQTIRPVPCLPVWQCCRCGWPPTFLLCSNLFLGFKMFKSPALTSCHTSPPQILWGKKNIGPSEICGNKNDATQEACKICSCVMSSWPQRNWGNFLVDKVWEKTMPLGSNNLLRMVMEPKYYAEEVIGHPNHHLRIWLDS